MDQRTRSVARKATHRKKTARRPPAPAARAPSQDRSRQTVEVILQATEDLLIKEGWEGLTTNRVAERAGVSVGSLYQYFRNKEALVDAVLQAHMDLHMDLLARMTLDMQDAPLEGAVRAYVRMMFTSHAEHPRKHQALMEHLPRVHGWKATLAFNERAQRLVSAYLRTQQPNIRPTDPDLAAFMLVLTVDALLHGWILRDPARLTDETVLEEACQMVLGYLRPAMPAR
jgi:AcrR family transcriptional regulator